MAKESGNGATLRLALLLGALFAASCLVGECQAGWKDGAAPALLPLLVLVKIVYIEDRDPELLIKKYEEWVRILKEEKGVPCRAKAMDNNAFFFYFQDEGWETIKHFFLAQDEVDGILVEDMTEWRADDEGEHHLREDEEELDDRAPGLSFNEKQRRAIYNRREKMCKRRLQAELEKHHHRITERRERRATKHDEL